MYKKSNGPLSGVKVIELAHIMAGPVCGMMLADLGADVIKVEKLPYGDDARAFIPPEINGESAAFMMINRNKKGIAVNIKKPEGNRIVRSLIDQSNILIENYRAGTMEKLGLDYKLLKKTNPKLIYCEISGFGRTGPYKDRPGFDLIAQGMSGLMSITGEGPGKPLVKSGAPITDITSGILAAMGALAAYVNQIKTGEGQRVDTSLFEAGIIQTYWQSAIALATGIAPEPMGSAHPLNAPYQAYKTKDGWITIGAANQKNWLKLTRALNCQSLAKDARFTNNTARMNNLVELNEILSKILVQKTQKVWLKKLQTLGVPAGPVLNINQMHKDPHVIDREMIISSVHEKLGTISTLGCPIKFSETPASIRTAAPTYGQHTRHILKKIGYTESQIEKLIGDGVIA